MFKVVYSPFFFFLTWWNIADAKTIGKVKDAKQRYHAGNCACVKFTLDDISFSLSH